MVIAPDIEAVPGTDGLDDLVASLIATCQTNRIPVIFALSRKALGTLLINPAVEIACVGLPNVTGAEKQFAEVQATLQSLQ